MAAVMVNAGRRSYEERMAEQRQKLREALIFNQHAPPLGLGPTTSARHHPRHATDHKQISGYTHTRAVVATGASSPLCSRSGTRTATAWWINRV